MAKILQLCKQQQLLDNCKKEIIKHGLETLEELEQAKVAKNEELACQEASVSSLAKAAGFLTNPALDPKAFLDLPSSFWEDLGFSSRTL
jgi:hypothetical protein